MKINLNLLPKEINEELIITKNYYELSDIKDLSPVKVLGIIKYNASDEIAINLNVSGTMKLTDAITNDLIDYPFSFEIDEILESLEGESEKYFEKNQNILDIIEFLWENIVLEVPIRITNEENVHLSGEGWELNNVSSKDEIDPRLQELSKIFKGGE